MVTYVLRRCNIRGTLQRRGLAALLLLALMPAIPTTSTRATATLQQLAFITAHDAAPGDGFGSGVALSADAKTAIFGAQRKTVHGTGQSGVVYIFSRSNGSAWRQQIEIADPHPGRSNGVGSAFGASVALSAGGNVALVGAPAECDPATCTNTLYGQEGAVYVYTRRAGTWSQSAVLTDPYKAYRDNFGMVVALSGDGTRAIVGSPGAQANNGPGAAYIFTQAQGNWTLDGRLTAPSPQDDKLYSFGSAVALSRDGALAVVGAHHTTVGSALNQGAAYTYRYHSGRWTLVATLTAADGVLGEEFGYAVAVARTSTGALAVVGALGVQEPCPCSNPSKSPGAVYVFTADAKSWRQTAEIPDPAHTSWDGFGASVAITPDGRHALIGAALTYWWTAPAANGRAYLFAQQHGTWVLTQRFLNPHAGEREYFGGSIALDDAASTVSITAGGYPGDTAPNANQGAVYVYG